MVKVLATSEIQPSQMQWRQRCSISTKSVIDSSPGVSCPTMCISSFGFFPVKL